MSLENQVTRVSIGMKDTLKTLINKLGGNVTDELIDQYPELAASLDQVDTALSNKAPAGYGLGDVGKQVTDLNDAQESGFYSAIGAANIPTGIVSSQYASVLVLCSQKDRVTQIYFQDVTGGTGAIAVRRLNGDGWSEWEYVNPPMRAGVTYCTTERYKEKAVYKKMDTSGVIWWSTDQTTWNMEADRVGAASKNYVISRGENLITNGSALLGDNTNFSKFTFDGSDTYGAGGCFVSSDNTASSSHLILTDEYMPVDISKAYDFSYYIKTSSSSAKYYSFLDMFDIDKNEIKYDHVTWVSGTTTTLASELKKGDTTVILTSVSNWIDSQYDHQRGFIFWNYTNSFGYQYPIETYSRNKYANQWANGTNAINTSTNTITLSSAWSGPTYPAGTSVSQCTSGSTYVYLDAGTTKTANTWVKQRFTMLPSQFRDGTAFVKCGWLMNYFNSGGSDVTTKLSTVSVTCQSNIPIMQTVTLTSANWNSSAKTQTITVPGVLANETKQLITPAPALASQAAYYEAVILCTGQAADKLTFTAKKVPTDDLTVYVTIQEVGA